MTVETLEYNGVRFRRYPDAVDEASRVYYTPGIADKQRGVKRLHQEIYEVNFGPIPEGCNVYFRDENPENLTPENLVAQTPEEYKAEHWKPEVAQEARERMGEFVRPKADKWHGSPAGRAWHARHARRQWKGKKPRKLTCEECGGEFESTGTRAKFCKPGCAAKNRRNSGVDDEDRACAVCPATFRVNRHSPKRTCSKECAGTLQSRIKLGIGPKTQSAAS